MLYDVAIGYLAQQRREQLVEEAERHALAALGARDRSRRIGRRIAARLARAMTRDEDVPPKK